MTTQQDGWNYDGYGVYTKDSMEVRAIAPGLYEARLNHPMPAYNVVDSTIYGSALEAKRAAEAL